MPSDGEHDRAAGPRELVGDLDTRGRGANDEDPPDGNWAGLRYCCAVINSTPRACHPAGPCGTPCGPVAMTR